MKEGRSKFVVFCNVKDGLPFTVLLVVAEGEVEHPLSVESVCCNFIFSWVVG